MIADEQKERRGIDEGLGAGDGVAVAERLELFDEMQAAVMLAGGGAVGGLIAGVNDDANFLDAGGEDFFNDDGQSGFGDAVAVHEALERKSALVLSGGGDDCSFDFYK